MPVVKERGTTGPGSAGTAPPAQKKKLGRMFRKKMAAATGMHHVMGGLKRSVLSPFRKSSTKQLTSSRSRRDAKQQQQPSRPAAAEAFGEAIPEGEEQTMPPPPREPAVGEPSPTGGAQDEGPGVVKEAPVSHKAPVPPVQKEDEKKRPDEKETKPPSSSSSSSEAAAAPLLTEAAAPPPSLMNKEVVATHPPPVSSVSAPPTKKREAAEASPTEETTTQKTAQFRRRIPRKLTREADEADAFEETGIDQAVVLDAGAHTCRFGFAGDSAPSAEVRSVVGRRKGTLSGTGGSSELVPEFAIGRDATLASTAYACVAPIDRGVVQHWDEAEQLWLAGLADVGAPHGAESTRDCAVIVACGVVQPKAYKERLARFCLETLGFEACHVGVAPVLALFGAGYTTGLVVDCGLDSSRVVPVYDGFALPHAVKVDLALGGTALDACAARKLEANAGVAFRNATFALEAGEAVKMQIAKVETPSATSARDDDVDEPNVVKVLVPARCLSASSRQSRRSCEDAKTGDFALELPGGAAYDIGEVLFRPQVNNASVESPGLAGLTYNAVNAVSIDLRRAMYEGVLLVGAGSLIPGTPERLDEDLIRLAPPNAPVTVTAYDDRDKAAFAGAALVASLDDFKPNWILKEDAEDPVTLAARVTQTSYGI